MKLRNRLLSEVQSYTNPFLSFVSPDEEGGDPGSQGGGGGEETTTPPTDETPAPETKVEDASPAEESFSERITKLRAKPKDARLNKDEVADLLRVGDKKHKLKEDVKPTPKEKVETKVQEAKAKPPVNDKVPPKEKTPEEKIAEAVATAVKSAIPPQKVETPPTKDEGKKSYFGGIQPALELNQQILEAIDSDDPAVRHRALNDVVNGMGNAMMEEMGKYVSYAINDVMAKIPLLINQVQSQKETHNRFYSRYPTLNNPTLYPVIDQIGRQVATQFTQANQPIMDHNNLPTDEFLDSVAQAVLAALPVGGGVGNENVNDGGRQGSQSVRQPFIAKRTVRPPVASQAQQKSAVIKETIFG